MQVKGQQGLESVSRRAKIRRSLGLLGLGSAIVLGVGQPLLAQSLAPSLAPSRSPLLAQLVNRTAPTALTPAPEPLDIELVEQQQEDLPILTPGACTGNSSVITSKTICQNSITIPSLWWLEEQYRQLNGKLVNTWLAYPNTSGTSRRVDAAAAVVG